MDAPYAPKSLYAIHRTHNVKVVGARVIVWNRLSHLRTYIFNVEPVTYRHYENIPRWVSESDLSLNECFKLRGLGALYTKMADADWLKTHPKAAPTGAQQALTPSACEELCFWTNFRRVQADPLYDAPGIPLDNEPLAVGDSVWLLTADESQGSSSFKWNMANVMRVGNGCARLVFNRCDQRLQFVNVQLPSMSVRFTTDRRSGLSVIAESESEDKDATCRSAASILVDMRK